MIATDATKVKTGRKRADRELTINEVEHRQLILLARRKQLERLKGGRTATIDDLREYVTIPASVPGVALGAIPKALANAGAIRRAGFVESSRPEAHGRHVSSWSIGSIEAADRWLAANPAPVPIVPPTTQGTLFDARGYQ